MCLIARLHPAPQAELASQATVARDGGWQVQPSFTRVSVGAGRSTGHLQLWKVLFVIVLPQNAVEPLSRCQLFPA